MSSPELVLFAEDKDFFHARNHLAKLLLLGVGFVKSISSETPEKHCEYEGDDSCQNVSSTQGGEQDDSHNSNHHSGTEYESWLNKVYCQSAAGCETPSSCGLSVS